MGEIAWYSGHALLTTGMALPAILIALGQAAMFSSLAIPEISAYMQVYPPGCL